MHKYEVCKVDIFGGPAFVLCDFSKDEFFIGMFLSGLYMNSSMLPENCLVKENIDPYSGSYSLTADSDVEAVEQYRDLYEILTCTETCRVDIGELYK